MSFLPCSSLHQRLTPICCRHTPGNLVFGASQELRPQQAPSSQQANSPLNYLCLAVFSRLQSRESAESRAGRSAPVPDPRCSAEAPDPRRTTTPNTRGLCPRLSRGPGRTSGNRDPGRRRGARGSAGGGRWGGRGPGQQPRGRADPPGPPASPPPGKAQINY